MIASYALGRGVGIWQAHRVQAHRERVRRRDAERERVALERMARERAEHLAMQRELGSTDAWRAD